MEDRPEYRSETGGPLTFSGGCHCGAVRFEFEARPPLRVQHCNCSICARTGFEHLIVPAARFRLLAGAQQLQTYTFNTGTARHLFCQVCGVKSFYVPRSNPDGYSVNARCLGQALPDSTVHEPFDGRQWVRHGESLAHLSRDTDA